MPGDVVSAIQAQNTEVAAGEVGGLPRARRARCSTRPSPPSRKLQTPEQFQQIILKTEPSGATRAARATSRASSSARRITTSIVRVNGHPGAGIAIFARPGRRRAGDRRPGQGAGSSELAENFPAGYSYAYANDTTDFIKLSIEEVVKTLIEAIILVILVMFVFLQSWRAMLVPAIAIPVVLLGTFAVFYVAGFTINTLTLFGLVLAVGLLVDDAIVVVENVERLMDENPGHDARAKRRSSR